MTSRAGRVTAAAVDRVTSQLTPRDEQLVRDLDRLRVATSGQLQRLRFSELGGTHGDRTRRRVLARLVALGVLVTMERRIGGIRAGSAGLVFSLDILGQRLARQLEVTAGAAARPRHPGTPTERFLRHSLAVSELYVALVEATRDSNITLDAFESEPACWWPDGAGSWVKPDAALTISSGEIEDRWNVEVDLATESLPTLGRKFRSYLDLYERGATDPTGVLPRVLVTVPDERRLHATAGLIRQLPAPASQLLLVIHSEDAVRYLMNTIRE